MHEALTETSKKLGAYEIMSFIHVENNDTLRAARKADFNPVYFKMIKSLK
jgi:hypothetical protein